MNTAESEQPPSATFENEAYVAPPEAMERAERARKELEARGLEVKPEAKWWGFQIVMNQEAVDAYLEIKDLIADVLGAILKEPLSSLVALAAMAQKVWVQAVSRGYGCKLVSPWISPTMLIPVGLGPKEDLNLWWTVHEPSQAQIWSEDERFAGHESAANPALAEFNGQLICVHRGGADTYLWYTTFNPDTGWTQDTKLGGHMSSDGVALAVFGGKLHCVYKAHNGFNLWHSTYNGSQWTNSTRLPHESARGPALAVFGGQLHLVHRGGQDIKLWHATFNGTSWSTDRDLGGHESAANPALAVYGNKLHLVHRGGRDNRLWHATYSGSSWSADSQIPNAESLEGPALAAFGGDLYCIHRGYGSGDQNLWWTKYRTSWSADTKFPGHLSGAGPAAIAYKDKNGTKDQLMVVHRGWGKNRAPGSDTAEVEAQLATELAAFEAQGDAS